MGCEGQFLRARRSLLQIIEDLIGKSSPGFRFEMKWTRGGSPLPNINTRFTHAVFLTHPIQLQQGSGQNFSHSNTQILLKYWLFLFNTVYWKSNRTLARILGEDKKAVRKFGQDKHWLALIHWFNRTTVPEGFSSWGNLVESSTRRVEKRRRGKRQWNWMEAHPEHSRSAPPRFQFQLPSESKVSRKNTHVSPCSYDQEIENQIQDECLPAWIA